MQLRCVPMPCNQITLLNQQAYLKLLEKVIGSKAQAVFLGAVVRGDRTYMEGVDPTGGPRLGPLGPMLRPTSHTSGKS